MPCLQISTAGPYAEADESPPHRTGCLFRQKWFTTYLFLNNALNNLTFPPFMVYVIAFAISSI
jgi:hypothetical protein